MLTREQCDSDAHWRAEKKAAELQELLNLYIEQAYLLSSAIAQLPYEYEIMWGEIVNKLAREKDALTKLVKAQDKMLEWLRSHTKVWGYLDALRDDGYSPVFEQSREDWYDNVMHAAGVKDEA